MKHECHPLEPTPEYMSDEEFAEYEEQSLAAFREAEREAAFRRELDEWNDEHFGEWPTAEEIADFERNAA